MGLRIAFQRILQMEADNGLLFPVLQPRVSGNPTVMLVDLAINSSDELFVATSFSISGRKCVARCRNLFFESDLALGSRLFASAINRQTIFAAHLPCLQSLNLPRHFSASRRDRLIGIIESKADTNTCPGKAETDALRGQTTDFCCRDDARQLATSHRSMT